MKTHEWAGGVIMGNEAGAAGELRGGERSLVGADARGVDGGSQTLTSSETPGGLFKQISETVDTEDHAVVTSSFPCLTAGALDLLLSSGWAVPQETPELQGQAEETGSTWDAGGTAQWSPSGREVE